MKRTGQILLHVTGCIFFLMMPVIFSPDFMGDRPLFSIPPFKRDFFAYLLLLAFFYLNFFILVPKFYMNKRYLIFGLFALACFLFITVIPDLVFSEGMWRQHGSPPGQGPQAHDGPRPGMRFPFLREIYHHLFPFLIVLVLSLLFRIYTRWKQAEQEKANAELSYLKAQINPHFLFNTLNTIYSLVIKRSPDTADAVLKLSGMMRYVLTEGNNTFVPLEKEIEYITDYIDLQKIRVQRSVQLTYEVTGETDGKRITPILLIPFIENAFKYGVNPEEVSVINIHIAIEGNMLMMTAYNKKVKLSAIKDVKSGLGIDNTRVRLQLLYPGAHLLTIHDNKDSFKVELSITLS